MKVLFCAYDRPGHLATGPNAWLQRLVPDLRQTYQLDIETLFIYDAELEDCPTIAFFKSKGLPVQLLNRETQPFVADQVKALLKLVKDLNVKIVVANLVVPALYATRYLKRAGIPVIGVLHSNDHFYNGVIQKFIDGPKEDELTVVVAVSEYIGKLAKNQHGVNRLEVIPCGTPLPKVKAKWENPAVLKVMYAGRVVVEQKQILKLTQAFLDATAQESRLQFSIYGDGNEVEQVQHLIQTQDGDKVIYKGAVSPSEIMPCFQEHQVFTLMSDYEGMPVALMEAMACGLVPVCLKEESGINEIIDHGINGFIVNNRDEDYQAKLKALLEDAQLWNKMSQNAKDTIKNTYSSDITHQKWNNLLISYKDLKTREIKIPKRIHLSGELLYYGDNRKPDFSKRFKKKMEGKWLKFKLFLRPRTRLRAIFKNEK